MSDENTQDTLTFGLVVLPKGTTIQFKGIPLMLTQDVTAVTHPRNAKIIGTKHAQSVVDAVWRPALEDSTVQ